MVRSSTSSNGSAEVGTAKAVARRTGSLVAVADDDDASEVAADAS